MTEEEWLACTDPLPMLVFLRGNPASEGTATWSNAGWRFEEAGKGKDRKFRLFACACCRRVWDDIPEACNRDAVAAVEEYLEGRLPAQALESAFVASSAVEWKEDGSGRRAEPGYWAVKYLGRGFYKMTAAASALVVASRVLFRADEGYGREAGHAFDVCFLAGGGFLLRPFRWPLPVPAAVEAECATQAALLRCLFGNPFQPATLDPAWRTPDVRTLARAAYEERRLPEGTLEPARLALLADALEEAGCDNADILGHLRGEGAHVRGCWAVDLVLGKE